MIWREHGGDSDRAADAYGLKPGKMLDLSTGISPCAYPAQTIEAAHWNRLPTMAQFDACLAAARCAYGVPDGLAMLAGAGSQMLLQLIPGLVTVPGSVSIPQPSYGEHAPAWRAAGHRVVSGQELDFTCNSAVIVAPNNPTGAFDPAQIMDGARALAGAGGMLVVDGAFVPPVAADPTGARLLQQLADQPHVIHLRSFGKFFGMAGLRLGFAIGAPEVIDRFQGLVGPWAVNSAALTIAARALGDVDWQTNHAVFLGRQAARLRRMLTARGLRILGGTDLFLTVQDDRAAALHRHLAQSAIWTRRFSQWPTFLRVGVPADGAAFDRLDDSLEKWRLGHKK